ncbi:SURF1 family cytochrome oxidase biogenesis protein [Glaciihabitans sp. dw_435]|uniref:SURF1 family cytochrome oxidase biogenesis protein n=1 Tax=Glaciihabitans sp. dw_435 TaxID=2720081 RepID=UPI002107FC81|nr:SURF1 family cytochrome oxidase biogenesis protein [Glaciihabitans sp. dw_435]
MLALAVAAGFAALSQWQLARSVHQSTDQPASEVAVALDTIADPQSPVTSTAAYRIVTFQGTNVPGDASVVSGRLNGGVSGYWVLNHVVVENGASIAIATGWTQSKKDADAAAAGDIGITALSTYEGRYQPTESPQESHFEQGERDTVSVSALINEWKTPPTSVYGGYVVLSKAPTGLTTIDSPKPSDEVTVNWLNIFYAVEWVVFAGFAVFLWYRLVRDAWEREQEEAAEAEAATALTGAEQGAPDIETPQKTPAEPADSDARV